MDTMTLDQYIKTLQEQIEFFRGEWTRESAANPKGRPSKLTEPEWDEQFQMMSES